MSTRWAPLVLLLTLLLGAGAACARIPVEGPVQAERQRTPGPEQPIDVIPHPPEDGDPPSAVVQGFLHAMVEGHGDYTVARDYLTPAAAQRWQPGEQAVLYSTSSARWSLTPDSAVLEAELYGRLDRRGSFTRVQDPYRIDFGMVLEQGQWRISNPPAGLLLMQDLYERTFATAASYFFDPGYRVLVPELVHVPKLKRTPTFLVNQLLLGPSEVLRPTVRSAVPSGTALAGEITVTTDGVATVPLAGELSGLDVAARNLLAAQLAATLAQSTGGQVIGSLRVLVNGSPFALPQSDGNGLVPVAQYARFLATSLQSSQQVFGVQGDRVVLVNQTTAGATVEPIAGPLAQPGRRIDRLGVALDSSRLALVTEDASKLLLASTTAAVEPTLALTAPGLLAPQFTRFDEVWTMSVGGAGTTVHRLGPDGDQVVDAPDLAGAAVTAFRVSPDGMRLAAVLNRGEESQLLLLQVRRGDTIGLQGARALRVSWAPSGPRVITAVGWRSDRELLILGSEAGKSEINPYEVDQDAATVRRTSTQTWDAVRLQASPYNGRFMALASGPSGQVWRRGEDASWRRWATDLTVVAVAG